MNARLIKFWNDLQSSYYFIPGLMALGAILLAFITIAVDKNFADYFAKKTGWFYSNTAGGARAVLTTIAGSMMTVAAVTFSITMVAVTSAAGQYGPRLIGNFMRDKANQVTLGTFTATFVYCLTILRVARTGDAAGAGSAVAEFVPNISVFVAMVMTMFSVGVMIFFIHHIPETLNVGNITAQVGRKLRGDIQNMFPENIGDSETDKEAPSNAVNLEDYHHKNALKIKAKAEGYIQAVQEDAILKWATRHDAVVRLQYRPGDFSVKGDTLMHVWTRGGAHLETDDKHEEVLLGTYAMGTQRTAHQNILFLADELVEILARALSPGVNDPFTAINCINWFHSAIHAMMHSGEPEAYRRDENGDLRVIAHAISFKRFVSVICDQSRPYIASDRNTAIKMLTVLTELTVEAKTDAKRNILIAQIEKLDRATQDKLSSTLEREELRERFETSVKMINDEDFYENELASERWGGGRS